MRHPRTALCALALCLPVAAAPSQAAMPAAARIPLLSQSVLGTAAVRLDLTAELGGLRTEPLPAYSPAAIDSFRYEYERQVRAERRGGVLDRQPALTARTGRILRRLAAHTGVFQTGAPLWPWEIHVLDNPEPSAISRPGGKILISTGMIVGRRMDDAEVAAVLAHEMGHILTNRPMSGDPQVQRNQETEADVIGLQLMAMAGYDPRAAARILRRTAAEEPRQDPRTASHPDKLARAHLLERLMPQAMRLYRQARGA